MFVSVDCIFCLFQRVKSVWIIQADGYFVYFNFGHVHGINSLIFTLCLITGHVNKGS